MIKHKNWLKTLNIHKIYKDDFAVISEIHNVGNIQYNTCISSSEAAIS